MKLIVCLDNNNAMAFHNRRQSMDCVLRDRIVELVGESTFRLSEYSKKQFTILPNKNCVSDDFLNLANVDDYCFAETADLTPYIAKVNELVIFRWNRRYPADLYFPEDVFSADFQKISVSNFTGKSHKMITQEVYSRCENA